MASELLGVRECSAALTEMGVAVSGRVLRKSVGDAMQIVKERAAENMPVGTEEHFVKRRGSKILVAPGYAQRHVELKVSRRTSKSRAVAMVGVTPEAFYATSFVEVGTSKMHAWPWLVPAFQKSQNEVLQKLGDEMKAGLERARKRAQRASAKWARQYRKGLVG